MKLPRLFVVLTALFAVVFSLHAAESAKRPIAHEDVWLAKRVGAPTPSPDGKWVVFSVTEPAYDAKDQSTDLWLKSLADDSAPRRLTFTKGGEGGVAWSPDATRIAFTTRREGDEAAQIYVLNLATGGEAERITSLQLGARSPKWNNAGDQLMFISDVYPEADDEEGIKKAAKERKDRKYTAKSYEGFPIRFWDKWLDDRKASLWVQAAKAGAKPRNLLAGTQLAKEPGFGGSQGDEGQNFEAEWAPADSSVIFVASRNRHQAAFADIHSHLFQVPATGGEPTQLTNAIGNYGQLEFSADGKMLFATFTANNDEVYNASRLVRFDWPLHAAHTLLTPGLDRAVSRYALPDGTDRVYFTYEHAGLEKLYSVSVNGGEVRAEPSAAYGCIGSLRAGGATLVGTWDAATMPPEVYRFDGGPKALTSFNAERMSQLDLAPIEHFWLKTSRGRDVHNMIVKPADFDPTKKYPLVTVIHGGFASMWRDAFVIRWNYHLLARPGYVILLTNYTGSTGFGEEFSRRIKLDPLKTPADEINEAVAEAVRRYEFVDGTRLAAGGASYGGHMANWLQATTTHYRCIFSHAGLMDLASQWSTSDVMWSRETQNGGVPWGESKVWLEQSPLYQAGNHAKGTGFTSPILITIGENDFRVPLNQSLQNWAVQQRLQVPSKFIVFPDENHWILKGENSRYFYAEMHAWWAKYLN
ncbi:MAG: S9 family peptidase [Candidatus Didemnitutus sp.]|nr:S9 family peptidase [Candidatus Didemnitutus sp.]